MPIRILAFLLAFLLAGAGIAQPKQRVEKAADLPRFSYRIDGKVEDLVRDEAKFRAFAAEVKRDFESVLARYEIPDPAVERGYLVTLAQIDYLDGNQDAALAKLERMKALEQKPADKLLSGFTMRTLIGAERKEGSRGSDAYRQEVARQMRAGLDAMPYAVVQNEVRQMKAGAEIVTEPLVIGGLREQLQPIVDKAGALSSDFAPAIVGSRYRLAATLPVKQPMVDALTAYLAANKVDKPDIWAARDVALPRGSGHGRVDIAIWDSGVDPEVFPGRLYTVRGKLALIGFDRFENPSNLPLMPIPADLAARLPAMKSRLKGFSDLQSNLDSPEAAEVKAYFGGLKAEEYKAAVEELSLAGSYVHGTHVAGIALAGNPYARLAVARIEFDWHLVPDPCPSPELVAKGAANTQAYVDFFTRHRIRVVNMSWGGSVKGVEEALELCGIGKDPEERTKIARGYFETARSALERAIRGAPQVLFVAAAGNEDSDASFAESIPAAIEAPNLLTVGAVDRAGDEASFTSYGKTVVAHANGYQVESVIPGGEKLAESGTSMAAPQATNLAAKMFAVNPKLSPTDVIRIIRDTVERTPDGRRMLLHPAKAVEAARKAAG